MMGIPGGVTLTGFISPSSTADNYAVHDSIYGRGGHHEVDDVTARDAIPTDRRREGMTVYTKATSANYQLIGGTSNSNWMVFSAGNMIDLGGSILGQPYPDDNLHLFVAGRAIRWPANFADSQAKSLYAATATYTISLIIDNVLVGTIVFDPGDTIGTYTSVGGVDVIMNVGQILLIKSDEIVDDTLSDIGWYLRGYVI